MSAFPRRKQNEGFCRIDSFRRLAGFQRIGDAADLLPTVSTTTTNPNVTNVALPALNLFGNLSCIGCILTSVTLELTIAESLNSLTLTNSSSVTQTNISYSAEANFDAGDSANLADGTALDQALIISNNSSNPAANIFQVSGVTVPANGSTSVTNGLCGISLTACTLPATLTVTGTVVSSSSLASYLGVGTFHLSYSDTTTFDPCNCISATPGFSTTATATVVYSYTSPTPEPASMLLFGSGMVAFWIAGRKKFAGR